MGQNINMNDNTKNNTLTDEQCRSELRERFLWAASLLKGKSTVVTMPENIKVNGTFQGVDKDSLSVHIQNLSTPSATYPWSMLRMTDCFSFSFNID